MQEEVLTTEDLLEQWREEFAKLNREIEALGLRGRNLQSEVELRDETIRRLQEEMTKEIANRDDSLRRLQAEFEERTQWAKQLGEEVKDRDARLYHTQGELDKAAEHLARIRHAFLYRVLCRLGILPK